jgi:hypothetical protein
MGSLWRMAPLAAKPSPRVLPISCTSPTTQQLAGPVDESMGVDVWMAQSVAESVAEGGVWEVEMLG